MSVDCFHECPLCRWSMQNAGLTINCCSDAFLYKGHFVIYSVTPESPFTRTVEIQDKVICRKYSNGCIWASRHEVHEQVVYIADCDRSDIMSECMCSYPGWGREGGKWGSTSARHHHLQLHRRNRIQTLTTSRSSRRTSDREQRLQITHSLSTSINITTTPVLHFTRTSIHINIVSNLRLKNTQLVWILGSCSEHFLQ